MISQPKKSWLVKKEKSEKENYDGSESLLQGQADDYLDAMRIEWRRVPDSLWRYLKQSAPVQIVKQLADRWRGKPDLLMLIPISDKYSLACEVELKSKTGKWGTRQKEYAERMPVQESRSPEKSMAIIEQFQKDAQTIINFLRK